MVRAAAAHHGARVVGAPDADQSHVGAGCHLEGLGYRFVLEQCPAQRWALQVGRCVQALGAPPAALRQRLADLVRVGGDVHSRRPTHRTGENAIDGRRGVEVTGDGAGVTTVADRHHITVVQGALQVSGGVAGDRLPSATRGRVGSELTTDSARWKVSASRLSSSRSSPGGTSMWISTTPAERARSSNLCTFGRDNPNSLAISPCVLPVDE